MQLAFLALLIGIIIGILMVRLLSPGFKQDIQEMNDFLTQIKGDKDEF